MRDPNRIFISTHEAAKIFGVSRITIWNKIEQRKLWATKVGNTFMIKKADLARVAESLIIRRDSKKSVDEILRDLNRISQIS